MRYFLKIWFGKFPVNKILGWFFFSNSFSKWFEPRVQYIYSSISHPTHTTLLLLQSTLKKNVGVFASMLYVYYKFHMQCVNQQKVDKKEKKNCCTTAITLRRRKNQSQKYIYIKQTNKSFMNSYLIWQCFYLRLSVIHIIFDKNVILDFRELLRSAYLLFKI